MKSRIPLILAALVVLIVGSAVPILPVPVDEGVWEEAALEALDPSLDSLREKIRQAGSKEGGDGTQSPAYSLKVTSGTSDRKMSVFGTMVVGSATENTEVFSKTKLPSGIPGMVYDEEEGTAQLTPDNHAQLLTWLNEQE